VPDELKENSPAAFGDEQVQQDAGSVSKTEADETSVDEAYAAAVDQVVSDPTAASLPASAEDDIYIEFVPNVKGDVATTEDAHEPPHEPEPEPAPLTADVVRPDPTNVKGLEKVVAECPDGGTVVVRDSKLAEEAALIAARTGKRAIIKVRPQLKVDAIWRFTTPAR